MHNEPKTKSNNFKNSTNLNSKNKDLGTSYTNNTERKNEGNNDWTSVPKTYDKEESCHKHEKSATNNQWCSCNK